MEAILAIGGVFGGFALLIGFIIWETRKEAKEHAKAEIAEAQVEQAAKIIKAKNEIDKTVNALTPAQRRRMFSDEFTD